MENRAMSNPADRLDPELAAALIVAAGIIRREERRRGLVHHGEPIDAGEPLEHVPHVMRISPGPSAAVGSSSTAAPLAVENRLALAAGINAASEHEASRILAERVKVGRRCV
jgi:hypothetical protein